MSTSDPSDEVFRIPDGTAQFALTEQEAFLAMRLFIAQFHSTAGDRLAPLLADISIQPDGAPLDPAAWSDWIECIRAVRDHVPQGDTWRVMGRPRIER